MNILTINAGSSSVKYTIFSLSGGKEKCILKGLFEEISHENKQAYVAVFKKIIREITIKEIKVDAVAHRVVHGGQLSESVLINRSVITAIKKACHIAPLHDPHNLEGILACQKLLKCPHVAVFDTSFHSTIPEKASTYALPRFLVQKYNWKRYGFHGTSHQFVAQEAAKLLKKKLSQVKMVSCHLGNGASLAAINKGKSVDTSMGFTPLEGLVMGTRSGDLDPALVCLLMEKGFTEEKVYDLLNNYSGLKGMAGTNDMRVLMKKRNKKEVQLALDVYVYRIVKYLGAYIAAMNGVDVIVFTAGIGEHQPWIREQVLKQFKYLGLKLDKAKNKKNNVVISKGGKVKVLVIPTNEALMMARECKRIVS